MLDGDVESCLDYRPMWKGKPMGVEYIRRDAFPVEEIRAEVAEMDKVSDEEYANLYPFTLTSLIRKILTLLEQEESP